MYACSDRYCLDRQFAPNRGVEVRGGWGPLGLEGGGEGVGDC